MRNVKKLVISALSVLAVLTAGAQTKVDLHWIGKEPVYAVGQSFGVPFAKGEMNGYGSFTLKDADGSAIPVQSWPLARYNDGSVKWMGFYATIPSGSGEALTLEAVKADARTVKKLSKAKSTVSSGLVESRTESEITVNNGLYRIVFPTSGSSVVKSIEMDGKKVAEDGRLVLKLEDRSRMAENLLSYGDYESKINSVEVERDGEVASVVKVRGVHKALNGGREFLPFTLRFYIFKGAEPFRIVHTFVFDGDQEKDYIKGIGIEFSLPFREELQNRHVAFAGEDGGLWSEAVEPLLGQIRVMPKDVEDSLRSGKMSRERMSAIMRMPDESAKQVLGQRTADYAQVPEYSKLNLREWAKYNDYKLVQPNSDGYTIQKRACDQATWFGTAGGHRSPGYILAGDVSGGLGVSLKDFWQSFPAELDASLMRSDKGKLTVWMWSPSCDAMDLRHYDIEGHGLGSSYEDYVEGYATPYGIARTSELTVFPFSVMPSRDRIVEQAGAGQEISRLMPVPEYLHGAGVFGSWSLPATDGNDTQRFIEEQIDNYLVFYKDAVEVQRWYGFWNYGDFMHSFNGTRHVWNYDHGGKAWDNTELETPIWLWLEFLRSGREDVYRLAEAMTRHNSEVDSYHIGRMKGLGTRHNVSHWGCGAKEVRVGQAWWNRYCYYLTTDDRLGDIMHDTVDADEALLEFDPLIRAQGRNEFPTAQPTRLRWGPDWTSLVGNWFTEWERTGEKKWLDKINAGMNSLNNLPNGLFTGMGPYGYDPADGVLTYEGDPSWITNKNHLANLQSSVEIFAEILDEVGNEAFNRTYEEYASWYGVPKDDPIRSLPENARYVNWWGHWNIPRLTALAAKRTGNDYLAKLAWKRFLDGVIDENGNVVPRVRLDRVGGSTVLHPIYEDPRVGTNDVAQWNLDAIIMMALDGDNIPEMKDIEPSRTRVRAR